MQGIIVGRGKVLNKKNNNPIIKALARIQNRKLRVIFMIPIIRPLA